MKNMKKASKPRCGITHNACACFLELVTRLQGENKRLAALVGELKEYAGHKFNCDCEIGDGYECDCFLHDVLSKIPAQALADLRAEILEGAVQELEARNNGPALMLIAGEMTAGELRTAKAIMNWAIRKLKPEPSKEETRG